MNDALARVLRGLRRFEDHLSRDEWGVPEVVNLGRGVFVAAVRLRPTGPGLLDPAEDGGAFTRLYVAERLRSEALDRFERFAAGSGVRVEAVEWCEDCGNLRWEEPRTPQEAEERRDAVLCVSAARSEAEVFNGTLHLWPSDEDGA